MEGRTMNETETPRTDEMREAYVNFQHGKYTADVGDVFDFARKLERELAAVTEQRDEAREELAELKAEYGTWWAQKRIAIDELKEVTEQRDEARRLAEKYRYLSCDSLEKADETLLPWEITTPNEP
jgi:uncharacterized coiled-coil DUF342 family protein